MIFGAKIEMPIFDTLLPCSIFVIVAQFKCQGFFLPLDWKYFWTIKGHVLYKSFQKSCFSTDPLLSLRIDFGPAKTEINHMLLPVVDQHWPLSIGVLDQDHTC